ncbi:hypothetical protein TI04_04320 [Achromatium sp. WMS2]|nr:hypothetical protein TI04_04320 [Achromatium sp. WMS2]
MTFNPPQLQFFNIKRDEKMKWHIKTAGLILALFSSFTAFAEQKTYRVTDTCVGGGSCVYVKGVSGITFRVKYGDSIGVDVGDAVTITFDQSGNASKITNDYTGTAASISSWQKY